MAPIFSHVARSVGILYEESRLAIMPDDPVLGQWRKTFANQVGTFDSYPLPGVDGITEIVGSQDFYLKWLESPQNRVDSRQLLKARLLDLATGNWDRHRNQWRWARVQGKDLWQPVPEDPDQCFSRYGGWGIAGARHMQPKFMEYSGEYPGRIEGLTYNNGDINRWLLSDLEWPVFEEVARELQAQLTDELIDEALHQVPPEWYAVRGAEMAGWLRQRRDGLLDYAREFYEHLADKVDVRAANTDDIARVNRQADDTVEVTLASLHSDGSESDPYFRRRFSPEDTEEIRIDLAGGHDKLVKTGPKGGINVIVLGGGGDDTLDDSQSGKADLRDPKGNNVFLKGPGTKVREGEWTNPVHLKDGTWIEPRSYGHWTTPLLEAWWQPDQAFMIGAGFMRTGWAFRKSPWASFQQGTVFFSTGYKNVRVNYSGQWRLSAKHLLGGMEVKASGIETNNFFGFGNDTEEQPEELYKTATNTLAIFPSLQLEPGPKTLLYLSAGLKGVSSTKDPESLVEQTQPYGAGQFGELAVRLGFDFDSRNRAASALGLTPAQLAEAGSGTRVTGIRLEGEGFYVPKALDVEEQFGGVEGSLSTYLGNRTISLAARVGGRTMFGPYPWFEAAHIGGSHSVRSYYHRRFAGDSSLYGNVELRLWLGKRHTAILPIRFGVFGFADAGRVWLEGEDSDTWHPGYGGGLMAKLIGMPMMFSVSAATGDEGTRIYFLMGQSF